MKPTKMLWCATLLLGASAAHAQSVGPAAIDAAGTSVQVGSNTFEFAIGQVLASNTFSSSSLVVTPGVLQPAASTGVHPGSMAAGDLQVYPNPVATTLYLQPAFGTPGTLQYQLYDVAGKLVFNGEVKLASGTEKQTIDVAPYAAGTYTLQVNWNSGSKAATAGYKIQKTQ